MRSTVWEGPVGPLPESDTGPAVCYSPLSGVALWFHKASSPQILPAAEVPSPAMIELNHCRAGRLDVAFRDGNSVSLSPGDLVLHSSAHQIQRIQSPASRYEGISIRFCLPDAEDSVTTLSAQLLHASIDLRALFDSLRGGCVLLPGDATVERIFVDLYRAQPNEALRDSYFRLKLLELLLYLSGLDLRTIQPEPLHLDREQLARIKEVHAYLVQNVNRHITLNELAGRFHLSLTALKRGFKAVYGMPLDTYMRAFRLHTAQELLRQTDLEVAEIAHRVGYESHSRFAAVFRSHTGQTPSRYRKSAYALESEGSK